MKKVVFIVEPHMDDGILGCAGMILSRKDDCDFHLITMSYHKDNDQRLSETHNVLKELSNLGVNIVHHQLSEIGVTDGILELQGRKRLLRFLEYLSYKYKPTDLYLPYPSSHQDHVEVYEVGISLSRVDYEHFIPNVYIYEPYLSTWSTYNLTNLGKVYYPLNGTVLPDQKIILCKMYESQIDTESHKLYSINSMIDLLKLRGRECNESYAEAFYILREVR